MKGAESLASHAAVYRAAIVQEQAKRDALTAIAAGEIQRVCVHGCSWSREYSEAKQAHESARVVVARAREAFYSAVDNCPALRWRLLDEFAPEPRT